MIDKLIEKMFVVEQRLEIKNVSGPYVPHGNILPYIKIRFTPLNVETHSETYAKLRRDIFSITNQYKKYIQGIDTELIPGLRFREHGFVVYFKLGTSADVMEKLVKQLKTLVGKVYEEG